MVELEHARALLSEMGLTTGAQLLDAQIERSNTSHHTYVQFLDDLLTAEKQTIPVKLSMMPLIKISFSQSDIFWSKVSKDHTPSLNQTDLSIAVPGWFRSRSRHRLPLAA